VRILISTIDVDANRMWTRAIALLCIGICFGLLVPSPTHQIDPSLEAAPSVPIRVELVPLESHVLNRTMGFTCTVKSALGLRNVTVQIKFPDSLSYVSGDLCWNGDLLEGGQARIGFSLEAAEEGNWTIEASAICKVPNGVYKSTDYLYTHVGVDTVTIDRTQPTQMEAYPRQLNSSEISAITRAPRLGAAQHAPTPAPSPENNDKAMSPGSLKITGGFWTWISENTFTGYMRADIQVPLVWGSVVIRDGQGNYLGSGITGPSSVAEGRFEIYVENPGLTGFYVEIIPSTSAARVIRDDGTDYESHTPTFYPLPWDTSYDIGEWTTPDSWEQRGAWRIYETVVNDHYGRGAWNYLENQVPAYTMPQITIVFPSGDGAYYLLSNRTIHISGIGDGYYTRALDTVQHEYAHAVMHRIYGYWFPPTGWSGPHYIPLKSDVGLAWTEGWADFFPLAVQGDPNYEWGDGNYLNLETPTRGTSGWDNGDAVEGRVAGTLNDIFDTNNDGYDNFSDGFMNIWTVISSQTDGNFAEFHSAWKSRGYYDVGFLRCAFQNNIDYDSPPVVSVVSPNGGGWYTGTVVVGAIASDIDTPVLQVDFYYVDVDTSSGYLIGTDTDPSDGWSVTWNTGSLTRARIQIAALAYDGMIASVDYSDSSFGVDNTPPNAPALAESHCGSGWSAHNSPYFTWGNPGDQGSGVVSYEGSIDDGSPFALASPYHPTIAQGIHTVKVRSVDAVGLRSAWSTALTVKIDTTPPTTPTLASPSDGARVNPRPTLTWTAVSDSMSGVANYTLEIDTTSSFNTPNLKRIAGILTTSYVPSEDLAVGTWYWRVLGEDVAGNQGSPSQSRRVISDRIKIASGGADKGRVDVGSAAIVWFKVVYAYDNTELNSTKGEVSIDGRTATWSSANKRWELSDNQMTSQKKTYDVTSVVDTAYGLTSVSNLAGPQEIIWDRIDIFEGGVSVNLTNTGTAQTIWAKAKYEYDGFPLNSTGGVLYVNGSAMVWSNSRARWEYNYSSAQPRVLTFVFTSVQDKLYGLTILYDVTGEKQITWTGLTVDNMIWDKDLANVSDAIEVRAHLIYSHNMSTVAGGSIGLNGTSALTNNTGWATFSIVSDTPSISLYVAKGLEDSLGIITVPENNQSHRFAWTAIEVNHLSSNATAAPLGSTARIAVEAIWAHNGSAIANALVELTGNLTVLQASTNSSGYAWFDVTAQEVGDYLYNLTGKEAYGFTKALGWKSIRIKFGVESQMSLVLRSGYNLISLPVLNDSLTASSLLSQIGNYSQSVFMFNTSSGRFVSYDKTLVEFGIPQPDFSIEPNVGYFVYLSNDTTAVVVGIRNSFSRIIPLKMGYNLVGWTCVNCSTVKVAFMNFSFIDSAFAFNVTAQRYISYDRSVAEFGIPQPDFDIIPGEGYFIFASRDDCLYYGGG
jgi:hypothetical protein